MYDSSDVYIDMINCIRGHRFYYFIPYQNTILHNSASIPNENPFKIIIFVSLAVFESYAPMLQSAW